MHPKFQRLEIFQSIAPGTMSRTTNPQPRILCKLVKKPIVNIPQSKSDLGSQPSLEFVRYTDRAKIKNTIATERSNTFLIKDTLFYQTSSGDGT